MTAAVGRDPVFVREHRIRRLALNLKSVEQRARATSGFLGAAARRALTSSRAARRWRSRSHRRCLRWKGVVGCGLGDSGE
jgi:hypothetical protein